MFDGEASWFLIVLFVLWILESIAKARRRSRHPDQSEEEGQTLSAPTTLDVPTEPRPQPGRPRTLWEEIAEIARQQREQQEQQRRRMPSEARLPDASETDTGHRHAEPEPHRATLPRRRAEVPTSELPRRTQPPRRHIERSAPPPRSERTASTRWEQGTVEEAVARDEPVDVTPADERRSERWLAGRVEEGASTEGVATYDSVEARPRSSDHAPRPRGDHAVGGELVRAPRPPRKALQPSGGRPARRALSAATPIVGTPTDVTVSRIEADVHSLRHASRADLRRILILKEVLGPPVALREGPPAA